ncbi:MAG: hypothetical protein RLY16_652 [Bacteroidota bacterium]
MELIHPMAEAYAAQFSSPEDQLLQAIALYTQAHHPKAHMLSGNVQGAWLRMMSQLMQPARVLEIGTFTGYSALCLAAGLSPEGQLHTIEVREEDAATAQTFFNQSLYKEKITLHVGDAQNIIVDLDEIWDLVFIDADKTGYIDYYELILPRLRTGGIILADNVLFHGQVLEEPLKGKNAKAIHAFNEHVQQDIRTEQVLMTVRDGILMIRKK